MTYFYRSPKPFYVSMTGADAILFQELHEYVIFA